MKKCAIYVNIYKENLYDFEILSLNRIIDLYGENNDYDILLHYPKDFDINILLDKYLDENVKNKNISNIFYYPDNELLFKSTNAYNTMFLTTYIFESMLKNNYEYILIYQIDAFIFNDQLEYFLDKKYNYIGAYEGSLNPFNYLENRFYLNGGFSLRHVQSCIDIINEYCLVPHWNESHMIFFNLVDNNYCPEDKFFSWYLDQSKITIDDLLKFSLSQMTLTLFYPLLRNEYPFGCHAINKNKFFNQLINRFMDENNINYNNIRLKNEN